MVGRKVFKTRICVLYRKGRCHRQTCSFAHGDAELRRYNSSSSFNGRRDYRAADLRDKLGRQWSPPRRNSLERDTRDPLPRPRFGKKSDWGHKKSENDYSGSSRYAGGVDRQARERKPSSSEFNDVHDDQLKQLQSEIEMLEDDKHQLQIYLEESVQEADSLSSKIEELETQLSTEKDECKRISSKIRKFVKANNRHARIQEELKRSQARLERLGDQLGSDARAAVDEEDINISILSDEETTGDPSPNISKASPRKNEIFDAHLMGPRKDQYKSSPNKKRMRAEADERSKQAGPATGDRVRFGNMRSEQQSRWDPHTRSGDEVRVDSNGTGNTKPLINDGKPNKRKGNFNGSPSRNKYKDVKSTGIAANMVDEVVEVVEPNEKLEAHEISSTKGSKPSNMVLPPPPPPPPVAPGAYVQQFEGKNESVDVVNDDEDDVDEDDDEMLDVDIV